MLAGIQLKSATASYRNTEQERAPDAVHSHLKIFKSLQKFKLRKSNAIRIEKHFAAAKVNLVRGIGTPRSVSKAEARYARSKAYRALFISCGGNAKVCFPRSCSCRRILILPKPS